MLRNLACTVPLVLIILAVRPQSTGTVSRLLAASAVIRSSAVPAVAGSGGAGRVGAVGRAVGVVVAGRSPVTGLGGVESSAAVLRIMKRVADWQIRECRAGRDTFTKNGWENGAMYTGLMALLKTNNDTNCFKFLYKTGEDNQWQTGDHRLFADDYCVGQLYSQLYIQYRDPKMIAKFRGQADSIAERAFTESLAFKNKVYFHEWAWCDALYMAPPALAYLSTATGDLKYLAKADTLWWKTSDYLYDKKEHLFFRDSTFFGKREANGSPVFWSRGNGWVMGGLVRVLENMPPDYPRRKKYETQFREMAARIASLQQPDGSWHASLLDPSAYNSKETSGTGFFCYALAWGIHHGLLAREKYLPVVRKAWEALVSSVHPDGKPGYVQAISDRPDEVDYESTNVYGVGAFLLAGSEIYKILGGMEQPVLLPAPLHLQYEAGGLPLSGISVYLPANAPADVRFALGELMKTVRERTGAPVRMASAAAGATFRYTVKRKGEELPGAGDAVAAGTAGVGAARVGAGVGEVGVGAAGADREYYKIRIDAHAISVEANTSAGLYYAVQTIRQLIVREGNEAVLPALTLEDRPALPYRGVMMDLAHGGLPTVDEIKRQIEFLAKWKTNQYYFYNEVSMEMNGYEGLNHRASYTQDQIKEIVAFARERHVDVIPFVEFYGHLHDLLKQEMFAGLAIGKYGEELDSRNPSVRVLLKDWIRQYTSLFTSPFVHIGFDETWETNRISQEVDSSIHSEQLWLQHLDFVKNEWEKYGKTVLAWTDMNSYYPDILSRFPKDVIPVIWEYAPDTAAIHSYLDPVLKEKRPFFIQPGVSGWGHIYPESGYTYDNIDLCLQLGRAHKTLGFITSVWTDAVEPFVRPSWMFMGYGCIAAWQGWSPDQHAYTSGYTGIVYPSVHNEVTAALPGLALTIDELSKCMGKNTSNMPGGTILESWANPFAPYYLANTRAHIDDFKRARRLSEEAEVSLIRALGKIRGGKGAGEGGWAADSAFLNSLLVSAKMLHYEASRFIWAKTICDRWNGAMLDKKKNDFVYYDIAYLCHGLIQDMMDEGGSLKDEYASAWLSENMPYRLNTMLGRYDVEYGLWQKLLLKVQDYRITHERAHVAVQSFEELFRPDF